MWKATLVIGFCYSAMFEGKTREEAYDKAYAAYKAYPHKGAQQWGIDCKWETTYKYEPVYVRHSHEHKVVHRQETADEAHARSYIANARRRYGKTEDF